MDQIRESECPVAHTDRWGGSWMPTRYADIVAVAQEHDLFTSQQILVTGPPPGQEPEGPYAAVAAPPISSDPPEHHWHRRLILPFFAPQAVAKFEDGTRELCNRLIDGFIDQGEADAAADYAQQIPVRVIATMLGVPTDLSDTFTGWVRGVLEAGLKDQAIRLEARNNILGYFKREIDDRTANPRENDLITTLLNSEVDGQKVPEEYVHGVCNLMLVAGVDTTWSSIGAALWHLAQHPEHRHQLRDDPELWPSAIEELLRAYAPVTMARIVGRDTEFQGCPMSAGDRVLMSFPAANRDPRQFERPDEVILDREHNRHVAFGAGIHRCAGSNLARLELRVALQTFLARIPDFELVDPSAVTWAGGQVRGPRQCKVRF
ncbi:MAG: cytochrome P450 [Actinobacteria bacterium]|nr:cytochrome P450 [Actinomycetota bacterium]